VCWVMGAGWRQGHCHILFGSVWYNWYNMAYLV
jgi:hypothetical protein